ncbi:MAG: hypothetical protein E6J79_02045 [Deltaproteobacteria bacterium]|nr:MAG: hypothetical protein E6J79_02045 [Deltaproteobacteria bacterium]
MTTRAALAALAAGALGVVGQAPAEPLRPLPGSMPRALAGMAAGAPAPAELPLEHVTVLLGLRARAALDAVLAAQQDPRSPRFRRWLEPEEIADRFGPSRGEYARVRRWFETHGFRVVHDSPLRALLVVAGTAGDAAAALGAPIRFFRDRDGRVYHGPETAPALPVEVAGSVHGVVGLDDLPHFEPLARIAGDGMALGPGDLALVYGAASLQARGFTAAGHTIAVAARSNFPDADVTTFAQTYLPVGTTLQVERVLAGADPGILSRSGELTEVLLDSEWAAALAPAARVNVVIGSESGDIREAIEKAVEDRLGDVISVSFGLCELTAHTADTELFDVLYALANARGQTVLVASGDNGPTACLPGSTRPAVNALASSPHAVAVGGTTLDPLFDGASGDATGYGGEVVWNQGRGAASGGGESLVFARPRYQLGPGLPALTGRALPDLALAANPDAPGYVMVQAGRSGAIGGTSAATPALAGALALVGEALGTAGLGQLGPALYRLGGEQARGLRAPVFRDVTEGTNGLFAAGPGFDLATGWGSPIIDALAGALGGGSGACVPESQCLVPGTGGRTRSCVGEWLVEAMSLGRRPSGVPRSRQVCRDGDPGCDADGTADGQCTVNVALCLNVLDERFLDSHGAAACRPDAVGPVSLLAPVASRRRPVLTTDRRALRAAIRGLPELPTARRGECTATVPVVVPAGPDGRPGRVRLRASVTGSRASSVARTTLVCLE